MAASPNSADILATLVGFDTVSRNSNLALIDWIEAYLGDHGIAAHRTFDATGRKANLHAVIGPDRAGGLALAGHVDTVPADEPDWTGDPFVLRREADRLIGRGATDMKGFVACMLAAVPEIAALRLRRPVHLFVTHDEEITCDGARILVDDLVRRGPVPEWCVVGEPSGLRPIVAHKGRLAGHATVRGRPGHAASPQKGVNAVEAAAEAIAWLAAEGRRLAAAEGRADGFEPPWTTIQVGSVAGGGALNIIPAEARFAFEIRPVPGDEADRVLDALRAFVAAELEPRMHRIDADTGVRVAVNTVLPPLSLPEDHALAQRLAELTGHAEPGRVSYGTEAGIYQAAGIASIVCGPGDIARAHRADEWIAASELEACDRVLRALAASACAEA